MQRRGQHPDRWAKVAQVSHPHPTAGVRAHGHPGDEERRWSDCRETSPSGLWRDGLAHTSAASGSVRPEEHF